MRPQQGATDEEGQKHINTQPNARKGGTNKRIMKRVLSLLLSVLMVAFLALPAAAAETTDEPHTHQVDFKPWTTKYGNFHVGECTTCGEWVSEEHTLVEGTCTVCGYMEHEHDVDYAPGYNMDGDYHAGTCKTCSTTIRADHTYNESGVCTACGFQKHEHDVASYHPNAGNDNGLHYGSCSVCGLTIVQSHTMGGNTCTTCGYAPHDHTFASYKIFVTPYGDYHGGTCLGCGEWVNESHTYGEDNLCTVCGYMDHEHTLVYTGYDEGHEARCSVCNLFISEEHTMQDNVCTLCGYTPHEHKVDNYSPFRDMHEGLCSICNQWIQEEHNFVNGVCEACGCMDHTHNVTYTPIVNMDGERHSGTCAECHVWLSEPHTYNEQGVCKVCNYQKHDHRYAYSIAYEQDGGSSYHNSLCTVCGLDIPGYHTMSNGTCTVCGYQNHSHTWGESKATNDNYHAARCQECGLVSYNVHNFTDGTCSVCGYTQHEHQTAAHTRPYEEGCRGKCTKCEMWVVQSHTMVDGACTVCGYQEHEHTLKYYAIGDKHYAICAECGMYTHSEYHPLTGECPICHNQEREHEHTWDNGTVTRPATYTEEGEMRYSCTGCSATRTESIAKLARYCAHACTACGGCTLPASDASCRHPRCTCTQSQAPSRTTAAATLETTVPNLTLSAEKVELQPESPYGQYITQVAAGYRVKSVFDLSLLTSGSKYDLKAGESATVTLTVGVENAKRIAAGQLLLLHVGDDGNTLYGPGGLTVTADVINGTITFTSGSFSPFLLVENADTPAPAVLQVGQATVIKGREVTIPVTITGNPGFAAMGFHISYDKIRLELLECEMAPEGFNLYIKKENGKAVFVGAADYIEDGTLLNLRFKVLENAEDGLAEITLAVQEALNVSENKVSFSVTSGGVQVVTRVLGDVNDDGKTGSLLDILYLKKYLAGFSVKINQLNADMNEDGEVKLADLILLMQQYVEEKIEG